MGLVWPLDPTSHLDEKRNEKLGQVGQGSSDNRFALIRPTTTYSVYVPLTFQHLWSVTFDPFLYTLLGYCVL